MIRRPYRHQRSRSQLTASQSGINQGVVATIAKDNNNVKLTFSAPVVISGLPVSITKQINGAGTKYPPTSYIVNSPTDVDLVYAANATVGDIVTIPANVLEIRSFAGGPVAAATKTF